MVAKIETGLPAFTDMQRFVAENGLFPRPYGQRGELVGEGLRIMAGMRGTFGLPLGAALLVGLAFATGASAGGVYKISQKGRAFQPSAIAIARGDALQIVNDDGDLLHHAYVASGEFNFDSGEQDPGASVSITFPKSGRFDVLCAIHPKMRLAVQVQ